MSSAQTKLVRSSELTASRELTPGRYTRVATSLDPASSAATCTGSRMRGLVRCNGSVEQTQVAIVAPGADMRFYPHLGIVGRGFVRR